MRAAGPTVSIGPPTGGEQAGLAALMVEMQAHYRVPCPDPAEIVAGLTALPSGIEALVARVEAGLVGFAFAANIYPGPGLKPGFFLKELYVAKAARGAGIGRALMRALAGLALARGHKRIDWTADASNPELLRFYESLGAVAQTEKIFYRLKSEALGRLHDDADDSPG